MARISALVGTVFAFALAHAAGAADLPVAPTFFSAPVVIGYNWNGYYVGANIGWSRADSNVSFSPYAPGFADATAIATASNNRLSSNSAAGGIQTGYNWQRGNIVAGIEGDVIFLRNNANLSVAQLPAPAIAGTSLSESARLRSLFTIRPRLGYAWDNWLLYVTGGWALGNVTFADKLVPSAGGFIGTTFSKYANGWTIGGGVEYGLVTGWSLKAEYLYTDLGSLNGVMGPNLIPNAVINANHTMVNQIARIGFNYRFGGEHEVVVRYP